MSFLQNFTNARVYKLRDGATPKNFELVRMNGALIELKCYDKDPNHYTGLANAAMLDILKGAPDRGGAWYLAKSLRTENGSQGIDYPVFYKLDSNGQPMEAHFAAAPCPPFCQGDSGIDSEE